MLCYDLNVFFTAECAKRIFISFAGERLRQVGIEAPANENLQLLWAIFCDE